MSSGHFGTSAEVSSGHLSSGHFGTSAEVSSGHFGTRAEVFWYRSVLGPKCPVTTYSETFGS